MKLTYSQRAALKRLADPKDTIRSRSITNPTLRALKKRGLAEVTMKRHPKFNCFVEDWTITDAGRAATTST
jgi:hypothetical protein